LRGRFLWRLLWGAILRCFILHLIAERGVIVKKRKRLGDPQQRQ